MQINFKNIKPGENSSYLVPGIYKMTIANAEYQAAGNNNKKAFLKITFKASTGELNEKFFITDNVKTHERLQYLHTGWFGQPCEKEFSSIDEIGMYFEKLLKAKGSKYSHMVIVGGTDNGERVYSNLPYLFIDSTSSEEKVFQPNTAEWAKYVTYKPNPSLKTDRPVVSSPDLPESEVASSDSNFADDLPF